MKQNKLYGVILAISMLIFSGCGNDTKENPDAPDGPYSFFNATTPITITRDGMTCSSCIDNGLYLDENITEIAVQLLKNGLVESGEIVQMLPFDLKYGGVSEIVVTTTTNGYAVFTYMPPENYDEIRGQNVIITAIFEEPIGVDENVVVDEDAPPIIILEQEFLLQFR